MAKKVSTPLAVKHALERVRERQHRMPKPIVIRTAPLVKHHHGKKHHGSRRGGIGGSLGNLLSKKRMGIGLGSLVLGFLQKQNITIPSLPMLGETGTIGLIAYVLSDGGKNTLADDVCTAALAIALHEFGSTGKVTGVGGPGDEPAYDTSGYPGAYVSGF